MNLKRHMGGWMCISRELWEDLSADPAWAASWTGTDVGTGRAWGLSGGGHGPAQLLAGSLTFDESLGFSFFIREMGTMWNGTLLGTTAVTGSTQGWVSFRFLSPWFTRQSSGSSLWQLFGSLSLPGQRPVWHWPGLVHQAVPGQCERIGRKGQDS